MSLPPPPRNPHLPPTFPSSSLNPSVSEPASLHMPIMNRRSRSWTPEIGSSHAPGTSQDVPKQNEHNARPSFGRDNWHDDASEAAQLTPKARCVCLHDILIPLGFIVFFLLLARPARIMERLLLCPSLIEDRTYPLPRGESLFLS